MRIFKISVLVILLSCTNLLLALDVSGTLTSDATWTLTDSPVRITGDVTIDSGVTITVNPGVTVDFTGAYRILISGTMLAQGTITDSIIFKHETSGQTHHGIDIKSTTTTSIFSYCRFQDGIADADGSYGGDPDDRHGGAIFIYDSAPEIKHCTFKGNRAYFGAGIFLYSSSSAVIENNLFTDNYADNLGGAIGMYNSTLTLSNNVIYDNSAGSSGGGISCYSDCSVTVVNQVISDNSSTSSGGGAIVLYNDNNAFTVRNTILWGNVAPADSVLLDNGTGNTITIEYCDVENGYTGTGNIDSDPLFINASGFDFHLQTGSPCIDCGVSTGAPAADYDGNGTNQDGDGDAVADYDMGAFEFLSTSNTFSADGSQDYYLNTFETGTSNQVGTIDLSSVTASGDITVSCFTKSMPPNAPSGSKGVWRWFEIEEGTGLAYSSATLTLYYSQDEFDISGLASENNLSLWHFENGIWVYKGGTCTNTADGGYVQVSSLSSLGGRWAFGDVNDSSLPVTLSSFNVNFSKKGIELLWQTAAEVDNAGFELWKKEKDGEYNLIASYIENNNLVGAGNSSSTILYRYTDNIYNYDTEYNYLLYSVSTDGSREVFGPIKVFTAVEKLFVPDNIYISDNYPNPFNPSTVFNIILDEVADVKILIYNTLGQEVDVIERENMSSGGHNITWDASNFSAGLYFYAVLITNNKVNNLRVKTGKMLLLK